MAYQKEMDISKSTIQDVHDALAADGKATLTVYNDVIDVITNANTTYELTAAVPRACPYIHPRLIPKTGTNSLAAIIAEMTLQSVTIAKVVCINDVEDEIMSTETNDKIRVGDVTFNMWQEPPEWREKHPDGYPS